MTPQLTWTREADTLVLAGELDQDVLAPLWDARVEAMTGVTRIDLSQISRVDTGA
ncbi:sulfate transporter, partial [Salmonella enterica subsp. enterica serovar Worthington str. BCH-7253]